MEFRELSHTIALNVLAIGHGVILIFITLALVSRLFIVVFLVITSLIKQWWVRIIQNMLGVRTDLP